MGAYEGKKKSMYMNWASHFWFCIPNFISPWRTTFWSSRADGSQESQEQIHTQRDTHARTRTLRGHANPRIRRAVGTTTGRRGMWNFSSGQQ